MKKILIVLIAMTLITGLAAMVYATGDGAGIVTSPHDFSSALWNATGEICVTCHTPHAAITGEQLLWNHAMSTATYTMYSSATLTAKNMTVDAQPTGINKLCLACHDGTVALDSFGGATGITMISPTYPAQMNIGTNLSKTHPIGVVYDDDPIDGSGDMNLRPAATTAMGLSGFISDVLEVGKITCHSCHDVHNQESAPNTELLRVANTVAAGGTASGLCLTCHIK
ncbi:MAG: cytochrome C [Nitrospirota bacterium]